jgi:hypothetical protein
VHLSRASRAWRQLGRIEELLNGTGWEVKAQLALWQDAVGYLMATDREDQEAWAERLTRQVQRMQIVDAEGLVKGLASHLPLERIASAWFGLLWSAVDERRGFSEADESSSMAANQQPR